VIGARTSRSRARIDFILPKHHPVRPGVHLRVALKFNPELGVAVRGRVSLRDCFSLIASAAFEIKCRIVPPEQRIPSESPLHP